MVGGTHKCQANPYPQAHGREIIHSAWILEATEVRKISSRDFYRSSSSTKGN